MRDLVDVNCHLDDERIDDLGALLTRARHAGVSDILSSGVHPARDALPATTEGPSPRVWRAIGLHPQECGAIDLPAVLALLEERAGAPGVIALGEMGLDKRPGMPPLTEQRRAFEAQLDLARALQLPVVIHAVRAFGALQLALEAHGPLAQGGVLHGYTGPAEMLDDWLGAGLFVSFGGIVTNPRAKRCREAAAAVPAERLLVESDAPDHPPRGFGREHSEPAGLPHVLDELGRLRGEDPEALAVTTADNARRLLGLPRPGPLLAGRA